MSMTLQTFELYLHGDRQGPHFEPLFCFDERPAMSGLGEFRMLTPRPFFLRKLKDYAIPGAPEALC